MTAVRPTTMPLWGPFIDEIAGQREIAFMSRYYDDVEGMIAAAEAFDWSTVSPNRFPSTRSARSNFSR